MVLSIELENIEKPRRVVKTKRARVFTNPTRWIDKNIILDYKKYLLVQIDERKCFIVYRRFWDNRCVERAVELVGFRMDYTEGIMCNDSF